MVFLGKSFFGQASSTFDVVKARAKQDGYDDMLALVDTAQETADFIVSQPMKPEPHKERTFGFTNLRFKTDSAV